MKIIPITQNNKYNLNFQSKKNLYSDFFNPKKVEQNLNKINSTENAKELYTGLTTLAGAVLAEFVLFAQENEEVKNFTENLLKTLNLKQKEEPQKAEKDNLELTIKAKPERKVFLKITSYFPDLDAQYKSMLQKTINEPENQKNQSVVNILEDIFAYMADEKRLILMKSYIETLNEYASSLEGIAANIESTTKNGNSLMYYLVLLNKGKLSHEDINIWAKANNLSCDEFMLVKNYLNEPQMINLHNLKKENNNFQIKSFKEVENDVSDTPRFAFKLDFAENLPVNEKLKTVSQIHKALYGEITLKEGKDNLKEFLFKDLQTEMIDSLVKDNRIDSVYNFIKYLDPSALKNYNFSNKEIKFSDKNTYSKIKKICTDTIMALNEENPKVKEFCEALSDNSLFGNIIKSRHAKMRFVTRIILKDNPNSNLKKDIKEKVCILTEALNQEMDKCNYYPYIKLNRNAPQFYIRDNRLGDFVKITINNGGTIHTIFEDFNKELKQKEQEEFENN